MSDLRELYQEVILDHGRRPRNLRKVDGATHEADGHNPLCGDRLHLELLLEAGVVKDVAFTGAGCAISTASASTLTEAVVGKSRDEIATLFGALHDLVTGKTPALDEEQLGKLAVFSGVSEFPMRVKCASLAWHTLMAALEGTGSTSTE